MAIGSKDIILTAVGFILVAIMTPIGMSVMIGANVTGWNASVLTMFQVLLPVLYIIGAALYFIPKIGK